MALMSITCQMMNYILQSSFIHTLVRHHKKRAKKPTKMVETLDKYIDIFNVVASVR